MIDSLKVVVVIAYPYSAGVPSAHRGSLTRGELMFLRLDIFYVLSGPDIPTAVCISCIALSIIHCPVLMQFLPLLDI